MTNLPVTGEFEITAVYGQSGNLWANGHKGIDFVSQNKTVYSTCDGTVRVIAFDKSGWGRYVSIGDSEGKRHIFCHLEEGSVLVKEGQKVSRSTVIGKMGDTGNVTGVHLHYQLNSKDGVPIDPTVHLGIPNRTGKYNSKDYDMANFKDFDSISSWARNAVTKVADKGLMEGDEKGNFNPKKNLTREEAAVILSRLIDRKE